jgi:hypothetical protein
MDKMIYEQQKEKSMVFQYYAVAVLLLLFAGINIFVPIGVSWLRWWHILIISFISLALFKRRFEEKNLTAIKFTGIVVEVFFWLIIFLYILKLSGITVFAIQEANEQIASNYNQEYAVLLFDLYIQFKPIALYLWTLSITCFMLNISESVIIKGRKYKIILCAGIGAVFVFLGCGLDHFLKTNYLPFWFVNIGFLILSFGYWRLAILERYEHI